MQRLDYLPETPSQTAGPYVHIGCTPGFTGIDTYGADLGATMKTGAVRGREIAIEGRIFDGTGMPIRDAMVEIWQADGDGHFPGHSPQADPNFTGWGRCATDGETGLYRFETVMPGRVPFGDGRMQAPHVTLWIAARGINVGLHTRAYFADEAANDEDPILSRIEHRSRVPTMIARRQEGGYLFDIYLQGPSETIFLDI